MRPPSREIIDVPPGHPEVKSEIIKLGTVPNFTIIDLLADNDKMFSSFFSAKEMCV
jgi:hypothetical protein